MAIATKKKAVETAAPAARERFQHFRSPEKEQLPTGAYKVARGRVSIQEFTRIAFQEGDHREGVHNPSWYGVPTFEEAIRIQREGYIPQGKPVTLPPMQSDGDAIYMERAVVGQFPDPAAWLRGEPESMYNMVFDPRPTPTLHLAVMMNVLAGVSGEEQQAHADAVYACIRSLQNSGYQVTLTALFYNDMLHAGVYEELQVEILREGQVLSQAAIGARFHLSFYRVAWFSWSRLHFGNNGASRTPPKYVDGGTRLVIPSCQFMPDTGKRDPRTGNRIRQSVADFVAEALRNKTAAAV